LVVDCGLRYVVSLGHDANGAAAGAGHMVGVRVGARARVRVRVRARGLRPPLSATSTEPVLDDRITATASASVASACSAMQAP
jgi:hypothetical protein